MTGLKILAGVALAGLCALAPLARAQDQEYWLKIERNGVGFGWEHTRVIGLPDGRREYLVEGLLKVDLVGLSPQEISHEGRFLVDRDLRPLSFRFRTQSKVKETQVSGQCSGDRLHLSATDSIGLKREHGLDCRDVYFHPSLADLITRRSGERSFRVTLFDPTAIELQPVEVRMTRADAAELEAQVGDARRYRLDRAGGVIEVEMPLLRMRAFRTDPEDAQDITFLDTADGLTLTVRAKGALPNPFKVRSARVAVAWRGIPREEFRLEDKRQRILSESGSQGAQRVLLEIRRIDPGSPGSPGIPAPVRAPGFSEYLAEDEYITPNDAAIRRQLAEIRGEETDALAIVKRILSWIRANISTDLIVETLAAPQVLARRSGKCSEYAVLFAALARAAGIPAKIVLGQVTTGRDWVGHMWNEVWLGEWLPVDPSMGSFVGGPSHLKLVDAPTVKGTQTLRMKLVDNLALEILGFEEDQTAPSIELKTGVTGNMYTNAAYRCRLSRPDDTWTLDETTNGSTVSVVFQARDKTAARFELTMFAVPPGYPAAAILNGRMKALAGILGPLEILESGRTRIAGYEAERIAYRVQKPRDDTAAPPLVSENLLFVHGASGYLFKLAFPEGSEREARAAFAGILSSFEFVP